MTNGLNKFQTPMNKFNSKNIDQHTQKVNEQILILIIGHNEELTNLQNELKLIGVNVVLMNNLTEEAIMKHALEIDCIITCFNKLEKTIAILKENDILKTLFIPVIVYSHLNNSYSRKVSYLYGVDDFISSRIDVQEIIIRINRLIERKRLLNTFIFSDELTAAYNRKYLMVKYSKCTHLNKSFILALIDLDCFKCINDQYGYIVGDNVLLRFVSEVNNFLQKDDVLIRLGGDEFLILFSSNDFSMIHKLMIKIHHHFTHVVFNYEQESFSCHFSASITEVSPTNTSLNRVIKQAQAMLEKAKQDGGSRIYIPDEFR